MLLLNASYIEECNEFLGGLRLNVRGNQVENGILKGALQANQCGSAKFLRMDFDRRVHFAGARMPGMVPCAMMTSGDSWYHGSTSEGRDLCGFNTTKIKDTDTHWVGEMSVMYVPEALLRYNLEQIGDDTALRRLEAFNSITLTPEQRGDFKRLFHQGISGTLQSDEQILNYLSLCLASDSTLQALPPINQNFHYFVMACQHHSKDGPVGIPRIIKTANDLGACQLTHSQLHKGGFKAMHGLAPRDYFTRFRLEEVRCAFIRGEVSSVAQGMKKYRFGNNKQHFKKMFLEAFGEEPLTVLNRGLRALK